MTEVEEELTLPADTLQILNEFLKEKAEREREEFESVHKKAGKAAQFAEDWQLSQFWYNESTKQALGCAVKHLTQSGANDNYSIALLSCPSLYATVKELNKNTKLFEFDKRFSAYGEDFVYYDFNEPDTTEYLALYGSFDLIIADPPFLSEECITKMCKIIRHLQKPKTKIIFCSGAIVEPWLTDWFSLKVCKFQPEHERNLGNEFVSYANFDLDSLIED